VTTNPRFFPTALGLMALLAGSFAGPAAARSAGGGNTAGTVADVQALAGSLAVALDWRGDVPLPAQATLILATNGGVEIARQTLTPAAGGQSATFPGALANARLDGGFYHLTLADDAGHALASLPFDVVLSCSDAVHCTQAVRPGFAGAPGTPMVSGELSAALDAADAAPTGNQLDQVATMNPSLRGEVYTYGDRLQRQVAAAPDLPKIGDCLCSWIPSVFPRPARASSIRVDAGPTSQRGTRGPGAANWLTGTFDGIAFPIPTQYRSTNYQVEGETEMRLALRCNRLAGFEAKQIVIDGVPTVVYVPVLGEPCPGCQGTVDNYAEYYATVSAFSEKATVGDGSPTATAREEGTYSVNGLVLFNRAEQVTQNGNSNSTSEIVDSGSRTVPQPATSLLKTKGRSYAQGASDADATAKAANSYLMGMYGWAACAQVRDAAVWSYTSYENRTQDLKDNLKVFFAQFGKAVNP
jgi:hypothetical protein